MKKFVYRAKDKTGKTITGQVEASDPNRAAKLLKQRGLIVISIKPAGGLADIFANLRTNISKSDISAFTRQLSTMINAGLAITESLSILRMQAKESMQPIVTSI